MADYPEHDKMAELRDQIDVVTDFLEWCGGHGRHVVSIDPDASHRRIVVGEVFGIRGLLAAYFEIDERKLETEKRAMLKALREEGRS